jgi:hypothetical protein
MESVDDAYHIAVAYARAVAQQDYDGADSLVSEDSNALELILPLCWLLNAAMSRLSVHEECTLNDMWLKLIQNIEEADADSEE